MLLSILFILSITFGIGLPLTLLVAPKINRISALGLSFPLGIGFFTFFMFLQNILGIKFTFVNEFVLFLLFSIPLVFLTRHKIKFFFRKLFAAGKSANFETFEKIIIGVLTFLFISSFISTLYWPVYLWDSLVLYDFRSRVFDATGFMFNAFSINPHYYSYPLLTSLAHSLVYLSGGGYPQFIHSAFYLSLCLGFYGFLREFASRKTSLVFTFILAATGSLFYHSIISYTNLAFTVYLAMGAIAIYLWDKKNENGYLILSAILIALSTWTRSTEPFWLGAIFVVMVVSFYRKKILSVLAYMAIILPVRETWRIFQGSLRGVESSIVIEVTGYASLTSNIFDWDKWGKVFVYLYKYAVVPWGGIFAAFVLALVIALILNKQKELFLMFFIVFVFLGILVVGTYLFTDVIANWFAIGDAVQRLSMLFYPLFIYSVALVLDKTYNTKQDDKRN